MAEVRVAPASVTAVVSWRGGGPSNGGVRTEIGGGRQSSVWRGESGGGPGRRRRVREMRGRARGGISWAREGRTRPGRGLIWPATCGKWREREGGMGFKMNPAHFVHTRGGGKAGRGRRHGARSGRGVGRGIDRERLAAATIATRACWSEEGDDPDRWDPPVGVPEREGKVNGPAQQTIGRGAENGPTAQEEKK